ncbi:hypothetical protein [Halobacterium hubeiense]|uniref:hypothetical protein n=1 Tax=Halobacterium hubeiense TaxID=1407499 RepID=UPI000B7DBCD0|nr:hypothetical protein [Halobacterium hubeiense]
MPSITQSGNDTPENGQLPGRYEWAREPTPGEVPTDPDYQLFSDVVRSFEMDPGASVARQDALGTPDAVDHFRGMEEPSATVGYDLQRFPVDTDGNPVDASAYGILRDAHNQPPGTLLIVGRRELPGGNDNAGVREYSVIRGGGVDPSAELDPSGEQPILMELSLTARKARSYLIHQPSAATTLELVSSEDTDSMDVTIESEDAEKTETVTLNGTTAVTTTAEFADIDAVWLSDNPDGDIHITDGNGTTLVESASPAASDTDGIAGGLTYSDDDQPVDGDRGVPALGSGSHADPIGTSFEHFEGDRFERPTGSSVRPRVNSGSWSVENNWGTTSLQATRAPAVDSGNRSVSVDADVGGPYVSHKSMMESLQRVQQTLEHELSGGIIRFKNTVPTSSATRTIENDQGAASISETFEPSGDPMIELEATA